MVPGMSENPRRRAGLRLLWAACVAGGIHAGFSLYWAVGGRWLLDTVGTGAVEMAEDRPGASFAILLAAALVKGAGAVVPVVVERTQGGFLRKLVRIVSWVGGVFLLLYGTAIAAVSAAVLSGAISPDGPIDRRGMQGHAMLWDPLFAIWGLLLVAGLWLTRQQDTATVDSPAPTRQRDSRAAP